MTKTNANSYIADELVHKVHILSEQLKRAKNIIQDLEQENNSLKNMLNQYAQDTVLDSEGWL